MTDFNSMCQNNFPGFDEHVNNITEQLFSKFTSVS